ncbi:hypothetical protein FA95DRAFT_1562370 [Auriscalpium vulgare]|uniref:Uncharacterized protein n=1 Tax=Auriscalpium vulgare TaxID=40419 RepID=A0ACB8RL39_9AGAM|nr:hypothetical protein FA95DRAFT_1562370 [Auriscalpium vulgare]
MATGYASVPSLVAGELKPKKTTLYLPILSPTCWLLASIAAALGHHFFNSWVDGKQTAELELSQEWVYRATTAFAFLIQTMLASAMSFVLCQLVWFYVQRSFMSVQDIDAVYHIERRVFKPTALPMTAVRSPLLVFVSFLSYSLPICAIFSNAALRVVTASQTEVLQDCSIPAGNLTTQDPSQFLYSTYTPPAGTEPAYYGPLATTSRFVTQALVTQRLPSLTLPNPCPGNCTYRVSVDSMKMNCNLIDATQAPAGLMQPLGGRATYWNATVDPSDIPLSYGSAAPVDQTSAQVTAALPFFIGWNSSEGGTAGIARCNPAQARYDFEVKAVMGAQAVAYNVTYTGDPDQFVIVPHCASPNNLACQVSALAQAMRNQLVGSISTSDVSSVYLSTSLASAVASAAFLNQTVDPNPNTAATLYVWGDVLSGLDSLAANITAGLLNMPLGMMDSQCTYDYTHVVYRYERLTLWIPYGIAILVVTICLAVGVVLFRNVNPTNRTTSFSDTVLATRNPRLHSIFDDAALEKAEADDMKEVSYSHVRFGKLMTGRMGYGVKGDF